MELSRPSHDELVKYLLSNTEVAKDFVKAHLPPELFDKTKPETLKQESTLFIDKELNPHEADILLKVEMVDNSQAYFYLIEHQSTPDPLMAFRLHYYVFQILKRHVMNHQENPLPLPYVYPILLYNGVVPFNQEREVFKLFGEASELAKSTYTGPFHIIDVAQLTPEEIKSHGLAGLLELSLCRAIIRSMEEEIKLLVELYRAHKARLDSETIDVVLKYDLYKWDKADLKPLDYIKTIRSLLPPELEEKTMTFAESLIQTGKEQGIEQILQILELLQAGNSIEAVIKATGANRALVEKLKEKIH